MLRINKKERVSEMMRILKRNGNIELRAQGGIWALWREGNKFLYSKTWIPGLPVEGSRKEIVEIIKDSLNYNQENN